LLCHAVLLNVKFSTWLFRLTHFKLGWFANPIYGNGDYPEILKTQLTKKAKEFGVAESPLPKFTDAEIAFNRGLYTR